MTALVLYAPNVHVGGGLVLLRALLQGWTNGRSLIAFLDSRARTQLPLPQGTTVFWVTADVGSRLNAEFNLRKVSSAGGMVLCFHGLPPLLPSPARILVFLQNRLYIEPIMLSRFKFKTRVRLAFERFVGKLFRQRVAEYIVQTPSMQRAVLQWYGKPRSQMPLVSVLPFADTTSVPVTCVDSQPEWDFVYVSDGEAHKNHRNLLAAWQLLAEEGLRPSLALTLSSRDEVLRLEVKNASHQYDLRVDDLEHRPHEEILALYNRSGALIFPSTSESFGLPLIEATQAGLPILAPELDYVRDVCVPVQTFDPHSPVSIARAVKRFLGQPDPTVELHTPAEFWRTVLDDEKR